MSAYKQLKWFRDGLERSRPTAGDREGIRKFVAQMQAMRREKIESIPAATEGLRRLVEACSHRTGQGYKLRALLFSLWNGKPASLVEILNLDWELRKDLLAVMRAFGQDDFFYRDLQSAFQSAGLFEWFLERRDEE